MCGSRDRLVLEQAVDDRLVERQSRGDAVVESDVLLADARTRPAAVQLEEAVAELRHACSELVRRVLPDAQVEVAARSCEDTPPFGFLP